MGLGGMGASASSLVWMGLLMLLMLEGGQALIEEKGMYQYI